MVLVPNLQKILLHVLSVTIVVILMQQNGLAQTRSDLEKERIKILQTIEKTSKELANTQKEKSENLSKFKALESQIAARQNLINNLKNEVDLSNKKIEENQSFIKNLESKYGQLITEHSNFIRKSYLKKMSISNWIFLLSSENINNMMIRWRYAQQFDQYTKQKINNISYLAAEIKKNNEEILSNKRTVDKNLAEANKNFSVLQTEIKQKDQLLKKLDMTSMQLTEVIKSNEKKRENLNNAIEKIIVAEMAKSNPKDVSTNTSVKRIDVESSKFEDQAGKLEWPVASGKITGFFGNRPHPTLKNVQVQNNGVDFTMSNAGNVNAVFNGQVIGVTLIPGYDHMVIIGHGKYFTVYSKLKTVNVSKGMSVNKGQKIGFVEKNEQGIAEFHFELWENKKKLNPQKWLNSN